MLSDVLFIFWEVTKILGKVFSFPAEIYIAANHNLHIKTH